jgi:hypothetical protein
VRDHRGTIDRDGAGLRRLLRLRPDGSIRGRHNQRPTASH